MRINDSVIAGCWTIMLQVQSYGYNDFINEL